MKRLFTTQVFLLIFFISLISVLFYGEYSYKKEMFFKEKLYDLELQYNDKIYSNKKISEALFDDILDNQFISTLLYESNNNISKDENRETLYNLLLSKYERMEKKGILQFHFHLANGESYLRFHKKNKYGDSILFRKSIQKVIETKKEVFGFEVGRYFEGFRYVYPIFHKGKYVGSVESSVKAQSIMTQMKNFLDGRYSMILKADLMDVLVSKGHIKKYYHSFFVDDSYYMANSAKKNRKHIKEALEYVKSDLKLQLGTIKPFAIASKDKSGNPKLFSFVPVLDINKQKVGYVFSARNDNTLNKIFFAHLYKYVAIVILFIIMFYFYVKNRQKSNTILQLQNAIDKTTLVSKTDLRGNITYVNDAFVKISGYSKNELLGKSHNIVRNPNMPKEVFQDLWKKIKAKQVWHGKISNRKKDGSIYFVDATIIPILDVNSSIKEFVSIRHDITELESYKDILKEQLDTTNRSLDENINYTKQYESAINNSTAVLKTDMDGKITFVNDKFLKVSGYSKKELIGNNCESFRHENHLRNNDCEKIREQLKSKEKVSLVFTNVSKSKELFFLDTTIYPLEDLKGNLVQHLHIMHDISEIINLYQELEDTQKEIIYKMGEIGETRSKETGNHVKRVAEYSYLLAILYGLPEKEAELLKHASPMHDIGKVGIPDNILKKPGKLDPTEWEIMQTHAQLGYEMLKYSNRSILKAAATVAGEHHEKWDGSGYPKGKKEEDIHIYGRITAIADVFDALGSDRVYKKAWSLDKILDLFEEQKGKHFDPKLVDLFLNNLNDFLKIRDSFKD